MVICAAGALLQYIRETQKAAVPHIRALAVEERTQSLSLDAVTRRNLELAESLTDAMLSRDYWLRIAGIDEALGNVRPRISASDHKRTSARY